MKRTVKVDHLVIAQVLGVVGISRSDPDFREIMISLELRYLDYQRRAQIKGLSNTAFNDKILPVLVRDVQAHLAATFELTPQEDATVIKQMHGKYHLLAQATTEEHAAAKRLINELSDFDQQVMVLFRDGLSQLEIADALGIRVSEVTAVSKHAKEINRKLKI